MILPRALVVSVLLHAALVGAVTGLGALRAAVAEAKAAERPAPELGALAGDTFEVDAVVDKPRSGERKTTATVAPKPVPAAPAESKSEESVPKRRGEGEKRAAKSERAAPSTPSTEPEPGARPAEDDEGASYGGAGLPPGVRHLATAFTQAISAATNRDPLWDTLALGAVGKVRVVIDVDEDGRITHQPADEDAQIPAPLERLVQRTVLLLRAGRFALSKRSTAAGREILEIDVTLSRVTPPEGDWDDPTHTAKIGFVPPEPGVPGRAYFVHASGRRFDARVKIVSTKAR